MKDLFLVFISFSALLVSFITLWYSFLKKTKPIFNIYNWTIMGKVWDLHLVQDSIAILLNVKLINNGIKPLILKDMVLVITTAQGEKKVYVPTLLWDMKSYIRLTGTPVSVIDMQKGIVPLPIVVPAKGIYNYEYEIMFMPKDLLNPINSITDGPLSVKMYALSSYSRNYIEVDSQSFDKNEVDSIIGGNYNIAHSTTVIERREKESFL